MSSNDKPKATLPDFTAQADLLGKSAKDNTRGDATTVTRQAGLDFLESHGITRAILDQVHAGESALLGSLIALGTAKLTPRIRAAREAGEDPAGLKQRVTVPLPHGSVHTTIHTKQVRPNRFAKDDKGNPIPDAVSIRIGRVEVERDVERSIPDGLTDSITATIEAALNG